MRIFVAKYIYTFGTQSLLISAESVDECEEIAKSFLKATPSEIHELDCYEPAVLGSVDIISSYLFLQK